MRDKEQRHQRLLEIGYTFKDVRYLNYKFEPTHGLRTVTPTNYCVGDFKYLGRAINEAERSLGEIVESYNRRYEFLCKAWIDVIEKHHALISEIHSLNLEQGCLSKAGGK